MRGKWGIVALASTLVGCLLVVGGDLDGTTGGGGASDGGAEHEGSSLHVEEAGPRLDASVEARAPAPSCADAGSHCGPNGSGDCCDSLVVPGGTFARSFDGVDAGYDDKSFVATVSEFRLDAYEVTVGRFRAFVGDYPKSKPAAGAGKNPHDAGDPGWIDAWFANLPVDRAALENEVGCETPTWTATPGGNETKPIVCVTWYVAFAFCAWDGGRLPTEAEWNYAAAAGSEQRVYPWSSPPTSQNIDDSYAVYASSGPAAVTAVGSKSPRGDGRWGHADLAGSVWEWTVDARHDPYPIVPCQDCADRSSENPRVIRGGSWNTISLSLATSFRSSVDSTFRGYDVGFRCAR